MQIRYGSCPRNALPEKNAGPLCQRQIRVPQVPHVKTVSERFHFWLRPPYCLHFLARLAAQLPHRDQIEYSFIFTVHPDKFVHLVVVKSTYGAGAKT